MSVDIASLVMAVDSRQVAEGTRNLDAMAAAGKKAEVSTLALEAANRVLAAAAKTVAGTFALYKIADLIRDSAMLAARYETMGVVMKVAGNNAGYTRTEMEAYSKTLQKTGISMMESRNVLVQLSTANIDLANATKLGRAAQDLAVVGNTNSSDALQRMVHGLKSGEVEILRTLGLNVRFEDGYKKLAAQLGTTTDKLTEQQKVTARTNIVLAEAAKYQGIYEESMTTAGKAMTSLTRYWEDAKVKLGEVFLPAVSEGVFTLTDALKAMNSELDTAGRSGLIEDVGSALGGVLKTALQTVAVVGANVAYVFKMVGTEIGGILAQFAAMNSAGGALTQSGRDAWMLVGKEVRQDVDASSKALAAFEKRIMGVAETTKTAAKMTESERIAAGAASRAAAEADAKAAAASKEAAEAAKKLSGEQASFVKGLEKEISALGASTSAKTLNEAAALKLTGKVLEHVRSLVLQREQYELAMERAQERSALRKREYADIEASIKQEEKRSFDAAEAAEKAVRQAREEYAQFGLLKSQVLQLGLAEMERRLKNLTAGTVAYNNLQREIAAQKELVAIASDTEWRDANIKAAKDAGEAWEKTASQIEQSLSDALMNAFTSGKGFAKTFTDSVKAMFNTMVLRPVISAIVSPVAGTLTSAMGFSGAANAGSSAGSLLGNAGSLAGLAGSAGAFGSGLASGLTAWGAEGSVMGLLGSGSSLFAGGIANGLGAIAGALGPIALGIGAVYALAKKLDHSGTPHTGGGSAYSAASGLSSTPTGRWTGGTTWGDGFGSVMGSAAANEMTAKLAQSVVGMLDSTATAFGQQAGYSMATSFADDSSKDPAWGSLVIKQLDNVLVNWNDTRSSKWAPRRFSDGSAGSAEYLAAVSADVRKAIDGIGLPAWATSMLDKLGDAPALDQLAATVQQINATQGALVQMRATLVGFASVGDEAVAKLIAASGGIGNLATAASTYYDNFYSEGEKQAAVMKSLTEGFAAINVAMPTTRDEFRATVEALQAATADNPYAAAALAEVLKMSGAFASVVPPAQAAADAVVDTVEEVATLGQELDALRNPIRSIKDIAQGIFRLEQEGASLQIELLKTYGDEASLRAAAILQRDIETAGMTEQELRLYDLNAVRRAEIDAIHAQRQAIADGVASWEAYFDLFGSPEEKQSRAKARVQAVLPADVDTVQEYKDWVWQLTEQFGVGSAEVKKATDVARDFATAFPSVGETIAAASTALTTDLSAYYAALFTPAEQVGYATGVMAQKFADLGLSMPTTVQGFKDLVAGLDTSTEAGRVAYNTVVGLAGAWKDLQPAVAAAVTATTDLSAYYAAYFTEAERAGLATTSLTATLASVGLALPTTRDGFRALVQAQDLSTESGIRTYNTLIGVAGAFADLVPAATVGAAAVETLGDLLTRLRNPVRTLEQIAGNIVSLEEELFQAQNAGNTQALRDHLLAGLTPDEQTLKKAIWAIEDYNQSVADTAAAAQKIASEHDGLWRQWLQANGDTAALRALDLAALDPANRALQEQVWALQDQKAAAEEASRAAETMASDMQRAAETAAAAAQKIAQEHDGLWRQWLSANGDTAALRALDLAALDPANRALQEQIWALEDQKKAADEATAAAEQMKSAWSSLTDSMLDEVRRIRGLIDEGSGAGYASLAAQFATATAQTRAGDQAAAKLLPGLSQSLLTAYESTATSLVDLQRVRALTANSLETTASLASGTIPAGYGMATAAPVYSAAPSTSATQATTAQTSELQGLRAEVAALRTALEAVVVNTGKGARLAQKWDDVGLPVTNTADGAPLSVA